jgi:hypothetical protein
MRGGEADRAPQPSTPIEIHPPFRINDGGGCVSHGRTEVRGASTVEIIDYH